MGLRRMSPRCAGWLPVVGAFMLCVGGLAPRLHGPSMAPPTFTAGMRVVPASLRGRRRIRMLPPGGKNTYRFGHFSIVPVIVAIRRSRSIARSRHGSLYGP